jgi:hypothetical protein
MGKYSFNPANGITHMADAEEKDLLEKCPFCKYLLKGLPVKHKCPECGKVFDRRSKVLGDVPRWYSYNKLQRLGVVIAFILVIWIFSNGIIDILENSPVTTGRFIKNTVMIAFWCIYLGCVIHYCFATPGKFITISPDEIALCNRKKRTRDRFPWYSVNEARMNVRDKVIFTVNGEDISLDKLLKGNEAEYFINYVNEYKEKRDTYLIDY